MFGNPMLDVAIGLIFLYLMLSIIVTVLQEFITSFLKLRNKNLRAAIVELIGQQNKKVFFEHPLIFPLFKGDLTAEGDPQKGGPAYIPKRNFALAILNLLATSKASLPLAGSGDSPALPPAFALARFFADAASGVGLDERIKKFDETASGLVANIQDETIRHAAQDALKSAVGELKTATDVVETAVKELESLFDSSMARAAGWYKVNAQYIALVISVLLAATLNADSIYVGQRLWADEALRNQAVAAAEAYYQSRQGQEQLGSLCRAEVTGEADQTSLNAEQWQKVKECTEREIKEAMDTLTAAEYPIGWKGWQGDSWLPRGQPDQDFAWSVLGMLLTGLAVSLGSSFWFDLLGRFMNVRMTGKREDIATSAPERPSSGGAAQNRA
jgi:hypothetical protein